MHSFWKKAACANNPHDDSIAANGVKRNRPATTLEYDTVSPVTVPTT
jgi:hypothetical protein